MIFPAYTRAQVNKVQMDIRKGHAQTVEKVLKWIEEEGGAEGITMADAGCGTGNDRDMRLYSHMLSVSLVP